MNAVLYRNGELIAPLELFSMQVANLACKVCHPAYLIRAIGKQRIKLGLNNLASFRDNLQDVLQNSLIRRIVLSKSGQFLFQSIFNCIVLYLWRIIGTFIIKCFCHEKVSVQIMLTRLRDQKGELGRGCLYPVIIRKANIYHCRIVYRNAILLAVGAFANDSDVRLPKYSRRFRCAFPIGSHDFFCDIRNSPSMPMLLLGFSQQNKHSGSWKAENYKSDYSRDRNAVSCSTHSCNQKKKKHPDRYQYLQHAFIKVSPHNQNLTQLKSQVYTGGTPAIVGREFGSSETESGRKPAFISAVFLCLFHSSPYGGSCEEAQACWVLSVPVFQPCTVCRQ